jgi:flagellar biosynthesis protein FlhF
MQTKTYFANSVPAALEVARQELGPEAMLVTSRPAPEHSRQFGKLEVTFAFDRTPAEPAGKSNAELEEIREQLTALRMAIQRGAISADAAFPVSAAIFPASAFPAAAFPGSSAAVTPIAPPAQPNISIAQPNIPIAPFREMKSGESRTLALIGPPGRGKTTSLVKIAVRFGLSRQLPVRIYTAGAHGVGQQEQMARYAAILGLPWQAYESVESLHLALTGETWRGLCLIDTPGLSPMDRAEYNEFAKFFSRRPEIEKHLVLRADATAADLSHVISRFSTISPDRLLFTGLDEALSTAGAVDALVRSGIPATFIGTGQRIPEDIEEAASAKFTTAARDGARTAVRFAAAAA